MRSFLEGFFCWENAFLTGYYYCLFLPDALYIVVLCESTIYVMHVDKNV